MDTSMIDVHTTKAADGWLWIKQGFALFRQNPMMWIVLFIIYLLIGMALSYVPVIGPIVLNLLAPVFIAGFMAGCRAIDNKQDLEINHLFEGFKHNTGQLVTVGGLYLTGIIVIVSIMFVSVDHATLQAMFAGEKLTPEQAETMVQSGFLIYMLIGLSLMVPLMMAYWFAPVLVAFHDLSAIAAMKLSFQASLKNIPAFFVYCLVAMVLLILAVIPFGLGMLVMIPTMTASLYTSYKDIFLRSPVGLAD